MDISIWWKGEGYDIFTLTTLKTGFRLLVLNIDVNDLDIHKYKSVSDLVRRILLIRF